MRSEEIDVMLQTPALAPPGSGGAAGDASRPRDPRYAVLDVATSHAHEYFDGLRARRVDPGARIDELRAALGRPLTDEGMDPLSVIDDLVCDVEPGLVASGGPRYFGFVVGGALPVAVAADWLVSSWDQNAVGYALSPALSVAEEAAGGWVRDILGLPSTCSIGFV